MNLTNTTISKILQMTPQGAGKWKKENRPIILLLEKYFSKEDIEEFLQKSSIAKLDSFNNNKTVTNIEVLNEVSTLVRKQLEKKIRLDSIGMKTVVNIIEDYFKQSNENIDIKNFNLFYKNISDIQNYYAQDVADIEIQWLKKGIKPTNKNKEILGAEIQERKAYRIDIITNFFDSLNESELFLLLSCYKDLLRDNEYLGISFYL